MENGEATSHKRKEKKSPQVQKWFLGNQISFPAKAEREKDLTSRPFILGKAAIQKQERWGHAGEKQELSVISRILALSDDASNPAWSPKSRLFLFFFFF